MWDASRSSTLAVRVNSKYSSPKYQLASRGGGLRYPLYYLLSIVFLFEYMYSGGKGSNGYNCSISDPDISTCEHHLLRVKVSTESTSLALPKKPQSRQLNDVTHTLVASRTGTLVLRSLTLADAAHFYTP